jgi:hypothetical protein
VPETYLVPAELLPVLGNLTDHGVRMTRTSAPETVQVERFRIDSSTAAPREFEGRTERTLTGAWEPASVSVPAGTYRVTMDQPLARLVFYLLEPRSDDGLTNWGSIDAALQGAAHYPILRVPSRD